MAYLGTLATGIQNTSSSTVGITTSGNILVGQTIIGSVVVEAAATTNPTLTITDTHSNSYAIDVQIVSGSTVSATIFSCLVGTQINNGDTITFSASNGSRSRWAITLQVFDDILTTPLDQTASNAAASASLSAGTTASTTSANELVYGAFGFGVGRTFTPPADYTASAQVVTTAGSTDRAVNTEWKYVAATGTQNPTATLSSSSTYAGAVATYKSQAQPQQTSGMMLLGVG